MSIKQIAEGYAGLISGDELVKKVAKERKAICDECPVSKFGQSRICAVSRGGCGCYLPAKRASLSSECPQKKWLAVND